MNGTPKIVDAYPLTPIQRGLLFESLAHGGNLYSQQLAVELKGDFSTDELKQAIAKVVDAEPVLRTIFDWQTGKPLQLVLTGVTPIINSHNISDATALVAILSSELAELSAADSRPPIRFCVIKRQNSPTILVITYHHVLLDGPGVDVLIRKIVAAVSVQAEVPGQNPIKEYLAWLAANIGETEVALWRDKLEGFKLENAKLLDWGIEAGAVTRVSEQLSQATTGHIKTIAKQLKVTPAVLMQAAWTLWLAKYSGHTALCYGLVTSTRLPGKTDDALGSFISTPPWFESGLSGTRLGDMARKIQNSLLDLDKAKHVGLSTLTSQVSPHAAAFDTILTISTTPLGKNSGYLVVAARENTGYTLAADIEIADTANITFASSTQITAGDLQKALKEFASFCRNLDLEAAHSFVASKKVSTVESHGKATAENLRFVAEATEQVLAIKPDKALMNRSFLEIGGDSILALKFCSALAKLGKEIGVAAVLRATSLVDVAQQLQVAAGPKANAYVTDERTQNAAAKLYGTNVSQILPLTKSQQQILAYCRKGASLDYQEQTAFRLLGKLSSEKLLKAAVELTAILPTLRMVYPSLGQSQVLLKRQVVDFEDFGRVDDKSLEAFARAQSAKDLEFPLNLEQGPQLRIHLAHKSDSEHFLFMSFHALVTDGWSFSAMLGKLFSLYASEPASEDRSFIDYSLHNAAPPYLPKPGLNVSPELVRSKRYGIDATSANALRDEAKKNSITLSTLLLAAVAKSESANNQGVPVAVYNGGRNEAGEHFNAIGPYSVVNDILVKPSLDTQDLKSLQQKVLNAKTDTHKSPALYYVYENYPREPELLLRQDKVTGFKERGQWRRQLLPPGVDLGVIIEPDLMGDGLIVDILYRNLKNSQATRRADTTFNKFKNCYLEIINLTRSNYG